MRIEPISVSELNKYMKDKVAEDEYLKSVFVKGEISNFKHHYTRPYVFYFERWKFVDKMHNV